MLPRLLDSLHLVAGLETVTAEWERVLGPDCINRLPSGHLVNARKLADAVPCRNHPSCRRHHFVDALPDGQLIATADGDDICCRSFKLSHDDRVCWRFDLICMVRDVGEALGLEGTPEALASDLWRLGTIQNRQRPRRRMPQSLPLNGTRPLSSSSLRLRRFRSHFAI